MTRGKTILPDLWAGLRDAEVASWHGLSRERVGQIRRRAGLPPNRRPPNPPPAPNPATWAAVQVAYLIAHAAAPVKDVATALGRIEVAVRRKRR
jgi:hypothetical protein